MSGFTALADVVIATLPWAPARMLLRDHYDNASKLPRVAAPVLLLHGATDRLIPAEQARGLHAAQPAAQLHIVPSYGHELAYQRAAQMLELDWLNRL